MLYIDFGTSPVKEVETKPHFDCGDCIHKIFIPGGIYKCSITNNYIFPNQSFENKCKDKDETIKARKCLFGVFTYNDRGDTVWTGLFTYCTINNITDEEAIKELYKELEEHFIPNHPDLKNMVLMYCLLAESKDNSKFVAKTDLISKEMLEGIIEEANKKFL